MEIISQRANAIGMARQGRVSNRGRRNGIGSMKGPYMSQGMTKYVLIFIDYFVIRCSFTL